MKLSENEQQLLKYVMALARKEIANTPLDEWVNSNLNALEKKILEENPIAGLTTSDHVPTSKYVPPPIPPKPKKRQESVYICGPEENARLEAMNKDLRSQPGDPIDPPKIESPKTNKRKGHIMDPLNAEMYQYITKIMNANRDGLNMATLVRFIQENPKYASMELKKIYNRITYMQAKGLLIYKDKTYFPVEKQ